MHNLAWKPEAQPHHIKDEVDMMNEGQRVLLSTHALSLLVNIARRYSYAARYEVEGHVKDNAKAIDTKQVLHIKSHTA